jgi:ABC-2 type transport system permease protein
MTTTTAPPVPAPPAPYRPAAGHGHVTFPRVVLSEWIKFRSLRSSWVTLLAAVAALVVIGLLIGYNTGKNFQGLAPEDSAPSGVLQGYHLAQLLVGVLGILFVSGEYSTGMIRSTLAAVPRRLPVLAAKALVFGAVALVTMIPTSFVAFLGAMAFRAHYGHGSSLSDPGILRVVVGTGVYLALIGLLGSALGWIIRSTPGAISTLVALLLIVPGLLFVLPGAWVKTAAEYLPSEAGSSFVANVQDAARLAAGPGFAVLVAWVVVALGVAAVVLKRRDG